MAELIAALDVQTREEAVEKVKLIGDAVGFYKIGLELYTAEGPDVVKAVKDLGKTAHADSSDAHEEYTARTVKIYFYIIHISFRPF